MFSIDCFHSSFFEFDVLNADESSQIAEQLWGIKISSLTNIEKLSPEGFNIIKKVISSSNFKIYWEKIDIRLETLSDAIEVLDLLPGYQRLRSVSLKYDTLFGIAYPEDEILKSKAKLLKRADIFCKIKIEKWEE